MDIFEEIKEAVLSATPGEDTRNYYRNQGMAIERERIIKLLEAVANDWHNDSNMWHTGYCHCAAIELIKGENK